MSFLGSIFGEKPNIADYKPIDLTDEQLKAISANIENFPKFTELGNLYQQYMLNQYEAAIPGFRDILKMGGTTTQQMLDISSQELAGEIPKDVQEQVQRSSAYQSLLAGTSGSAMAGALTARDLGLTSLGMQQQGAQMAGSAGNAAQRWAALAQAGGPAGMLVTTQQQAALDMQQNLIKRNIEQQRNNVNAAPDPALQALNQWVEQVGGTVVASYLGGGAGGMGGGKNYMTSYNPGTGDVGGAFGPQMESAFAGTDAYGNPISSGAGGMNFGGAPAARPSSGGYYGGYGGVSPGGDGQPAYNGIANNPFTGAPSTMWDQYAYQSNFPTG